MTHKKISNGAKGIGVAIVAMAGMLLSSPLPAATATALVSVRILGHADADVAAGAVTVSKVSQSNVAIGAVALGGRSDAPLPAISAFRVGGGRNATFAVALPSSVSVTGPGGELAVSGFRSSESLGRLSSEGTALVAIGASVAIPSGQIAGQYEGSYPVTIAYN